MNSYWNPLAARHDVVPSPNKYYSRVMVTTVVIHTMVGTAAAAQSRFMNPNDPGHASAHYGVLLDGSIWQWVDERDGAYHAGNFGVNLNSIGIEHEDNGDYNGPRTPELYAASSKLLHDVCTRYGIPLDRGYIRKHSEVSERPTACPDALDIDRIIAGAKEADMPDWFVKDDWDAERWRVLAIMSNTLTVQGGPKAGEANALAAKIAELEAKIAALTPPTALTGTITGTITST